MHIIRSRPKKQEKLSDKKIASKLQNWSNKTLDKTTGLNIIDKPVSRKGFAGKTANRLQPREGPARDTEAQQTGEPMLK